MKEKLEWLEDKLKGKTICRVSMSLGGNNVVMYVDHERQEFCVAWFRIGMFGYAERTKIINRASYLYNSRVQTDRNVDFY